MPPEIDQGSPAGLTSGIRWNSTSQVIRLASQWITSVILARLLEPRAFGLVNLAVVVSGFVHLFRDLGVGAAIIQKRDLSERLLASLFWLNIGTGLAAAALIWMIAPAVSAYFAQPLMSPILRVLCVSFPLASLAVIPNALLNRELAFPRLARVEVITALASTVVAIAAALAGAGVWSLVLQSLSATAISTLLLWILKPLPVRLCWSWSEVRTIVPFSANLTGFSLFNYLARNTDNLIVGKILGVNDLGIYSMAYRIMLFPLQNISDIVRRVIFPLYSKFQEDNATIRRTHTLICSAIAFVTFPMMLGLAVVSRPLVQALLGPRWDRLPVLILILAPVGMLQSISTLNGSLYAAKGRTGLQFGVGVAVWTITAGAWLLGISHGITGMSIAYAAVSLLLFLPAISIPCRLIELPVRVLLRSIYKQLLLALAMAALLASMRSIIAVIVPVAFTWIVLVSAGIVIYGLLAWFGMPRETAQIIHTLTGRATIRRKRS